MQPGPHDGGTANDLIAYLTRYVPLSTTADNIVDCAIATPISDTDISDEIMGIGRIAGTKEPFLGTRVQKSGRTSGVTNGLVVDEHADIKVGYNGFEATFTDVFITEYIADPGDSGASTLDMDNNLLGLVFAGSTYVTAHIKIRNIMNALDVSLGGGSSPQAQAGGILLGLLVLGVGISYLFGWRP